RAGARRGAAQRPALARPVPGRDAAVGRQAGALGPAEVAAPAGPYRRDAGAGPPDRGRLPRRLLVGGGPPADGARAIVGRRAGPAQGRRTRPRLGRGPLRPGDGPLPPEG